MDKMSRENARKIEFYGRTLEQCVEALLKYQKRGESVVVSFNGHDLYSSDVTMDGAYQEVLGSTKAEFDRKQEEWRKEYKEKQAREEAKAKAQIPSWLERGSNLIYPERSEEWKKCVEARASDLYHGLDLNAAIEIMEMLENGATLDEAKEALDGQDHSGASYGMVRNIIFSFSKQGPEFWEHTAMGKISPESRAVLEEKKKENAELEALHSSKDTVEVEEDKFAEQKARATELHEYMGNIDNCVKVLSQYRERGENVYVEFNGHKIYSCDVTLDSAYKEITGMTKEESDRKRAEWLEKYEREQREEKAKAQAKIPEWISRGESIIYPERAEEWQNCVNARVNDLYHGTDLDSAIEIMEMLENGATLDEAKEALDGQDHSGASYGMVRNIIFSFSKQGPEFFEHTAMGDISPEDQQIIEQKKRENRELEELHEVDSIKEVSEERRQEEMEILSGAEEKGKLTQEITSIQQQLDALKAQEAALKQALDDKKSKLNGLDEK